MPNGHVESPCSEKPLDLGRMHALTGMCLQTGDNPSMKTPVINADSKDDLPALKPLDWAEVSVVKGRLRRAIQEKRAMHGKDALDLDFILDSPTEDKTLGPEELMQIQQRDHVRKERNRLAAQRMRDRRKRYCDALVQELEALEKSNSTLLWEIRSLESEKNRLESILKTHLKVCDKLKPKTTDEVTSDTAQPLDLRTLPSDLSQTANEGIVIKHEPVSVNEEAEKCEEPQEIPLDLRVVRKYYSDVKDEELVRTKRPRLSSV